MPQTLAERTAGRKLPRPTFRQMAAAHEIIARATGSDTKEARSSLIAAAATEAMATGQVTLIDRLDAARLTEERLFGTIASGLDAKRKDPADHDIRLKASKLALELRGLISRGSRVNVGIGSGGQANVAVGLPWAPVPVEDSNSTVTSNAQLTTERSNALSTRRSTIEGTGSGRGAAGHSRSTVKSRAAVPVEHMSLGQLKNVPAEVRAAELERRLLLRTKNNPNVRKHVSKNHRAYKRGCDCKSGKCGKCHECKRRAKLRLPDAK